MKNCRHSSSKCRLAIAACVFVGGLYCHGQSKDSTPAQPAAKTTRASSNSQPRHNPLKKDGLKQLEEDLFKSFQPTDPANPLEEGEPMMRPPALNRPISKKDELLEEQRKNWAFMTPEQLMGVPSLNDLMKEQDSAKVGQEKKTLSLLEQYYQRQEHPDNTLKKKDKIDLFNLPEVRPVSDDSPFSIGKGREDRPKSTKPDDKSEPTDLDGTAHFGSDVDPGMFNHPSTISDIFGLGHSEPKPEDLLAHKARMEEFQRILNTDWHPPGDATVSAVAGQPTAPSSALSSLPLVIKPDDPNAASLGIATLTGGADPLKNLNAPTLPGAVTALPKSPAPSLTPPNPTFLAPRRQF